MAVRQTLAEAGEAREMLEPFVDEVIVMNANGRGGSVFDMADLYIDDDEYSFRYPCSQLFNNVYVTAEGYMVICCQDFENLTVVADLNEEPVASAWTNRKFTDFRRRYLAGDLKGTLCQNCLHGTAEEVVPITPEKSGYGASEARRDDALRRIRALSGRQGAGKGSE